MALVRMHGVVKEYDWGGSTFIPDLLGKAADGKPKAELWMGTHPSGMATLDTGESLKDFLARRSESWMGTESDGSLPFLLKVLSIAAPLSIQCHPTKEQALAGWAKEAPLRAKDPDHTHWDYQDDNPKAEMLYALTPVTAMCAFRPFHEIRDAFLHLVPHTWEELLKPEHEGDQGIKELYTKLMGLKGGQLKDAVAELLTSIRISKAPVWTPDGRFLTAEGITITASKQYPEDAGLFAPFLLNVLHLDSRDAVYLQPDTLHAYVYGDAIELMDASDNVLRGGLTHKKVDVPELLSLLSFQGRKELNCPVKRMADGRLRVMVPTKDFALYAMDSGSYKVDQNSVELLFCLDGKARFSSGAEWVTIRRGECWVKSASTGEYDINVQGRLFSATLGD